MGHSVTVTAERAEIRWGYRPAAELLELTITNTEDARTVAATLGQNVNTYALSQRPLVLLVPHANGAWRWPIEQLQILDGSFSASLGPREL